VWKFLHASSLQYNNQSTKEREFYKLGIKALKHIVPCTKCKKHIEIFLKTRESSLDLINSSEDMFRFTYDLHADVKFDAYVPTPSFTFNEALQSWKIVTFDEVVVKDMMKLTSFYTEVSEGQTCVDTLVTYSHFLSSFNMHKEVTLIDSILVNHKHDSALPPQPLLEILRSNGMAL